MCVIAAALASFFPALYVGSAFDSGSAWLMLDSGLSTLLTVVRDFGVLAIVASLALRVLEQNSGTSRVITPVNESSDRH
ncbi:MAG: hypothetical protein EOL89_06025 [Actinobacteria bacterium]|nr:hypothetical protein [Actinomycetota bacterium]